jgi:hypothetical protein
VINFGEDGRNGFPIKIRVRPGASDLFASEDFKEVELDITDIGLVVTHPDTSLDRSQVTPE